MHRVITSSFIKLTFICAQNHYPGSDTGLLGIPGPGHKVPGSKPERTTKIFFPSFRRDRLKKWVRIMVSQVSLLKDGPDMAFYFVSCLCCFVHNNLILFCPDAYKIE